MVPGEKGPDLSASTSLPLWRAMLDDGRHASPHIGIADGMSIAQGIDVPALKMTASVRASKRYHGLTMLLTVHIFCGLTMLLTVHIIVD